MRILYSRKQSFSASALLTFWASNSFNVEVCLMHFRLVSSGPGLYPLGARVLLQLQLWQPKKVSQLRTVTLKHEPEFQLML